MEMCLWFYLNLKWPPHVYFLSPTRRGSGILVAAGFCPAAGVRRHIFLWGQKQVLYATKIQNCRQKSTPNFFVGAKTLNLTSEIIQISQLHSPQYGDVQVMFLRFCWNSEWPPRINFNFFEVAKTLFKFYNHIPHDMEMCKWFFRGSRKFKMAAMHEFHNFLRAQKPKNWKSKIMCGWFYWNLKWPPQVDFLNICDRKRNWLRGMI